MNYLLYGKQRVLIDDEIKKIISENNINDLNMSKYNLEDDDELKFEISDFKISSQNDETKANTNTIAQNNSAKNNTSNKNNTNSTNKNDGINLYASFTVENIGINLK